MPAPNVQVPYQEFLQRCGRHSQVVAGLSSAPPRLQRLLAELVMMRLFDDFQEALSGVALRLACGAPYGDGSAPQLLTTPARSTSSAQTLFETHGRPQRKNTKWSKVRFINETTKFVLDGAEPFRTACQANSVPISEMQAVRNRIAHNNRNSRTAFRTVVVRHYGANVNSVSPGVLLLSPRFAPTMLERYIASCRIIVRDCSRS